MGKHARLAPSGAKRWMACPGSIALCAKVPEVPTSTYASEGTAAHELGAKCLVAGTDAIDYLGDVFVVDGESFKVDEDMAEAVQTYLGAIREDTNNQAVGMRIEKKFDMSWLCEGMFGTNDCSTFFLKQKLLRIYDYKHGAGTMVEVEWNSQLLIYALGAVAALWDASKFVPVTDVVEKVEIVIVQPRMMHEDGPVRRWEISTEDLFYWGLNILRPCALRTYEEGVKLFAGDHCKFCDASAVCPEKAKQACALAKTDFDNPVLPAPEDLTPEHLKNLIANTGLFESWHKKVLEYAYVQMMRGVHIEGQKLVKRTKHRVWTDDGTGIVALLGDEALKQPAIITPAQAEKKIEKSGQSPDALLEGLVETPDGGLAMVPESDRRKEAPSPAALDFADPVVDDGVSMFE